MRKCFKEAYTEAQHQSNCETDWQKWYYDRATSTMQLMPGDAVLLKADAFQSKRKVKDWWSEVEYMVVHQVADDVPTHEVRDNGRNVKIIHHNQLFLVATPRGEATPLGASESLSEEGTAQSTLVELTPLEWEVKFQGATWMRQQPYAHQSCFAGVGRWHSMASSLSGPETNI